MIDQPCRRDITAIATAVQQSDRIVVLDRNDLIVIDAMTLSDMVEARRPPRDPVPIVRQKLTDKSCTQQPLAPRIDWERFTDCHKPDIHALAGRIRQIWWIANIPIRIGSRRRGVQLPYRWALGPDQIGRAPDNGVCIRDLRR